MDALNILLDENKEIHSFKIRGRLSLKSYIYLINEYIELTDKIKDLIYKSDKLKAIKTTINV